MDVDVIGKMVSGFKWYRSHQKALAEYIGSHVLKLLTWIGRQNRKGMLLRRAETRLRTYHKNKIREGTVASVSGRVYNINSLEDAFIDAFHRRFYGYTKIIISFIFIASIDYIYTCGIGPKSTQIYGLLFSSIGGLLFARGLFQGERGLTTASTERIPVKGMDPSKDNAMLESQALIEAAHDSVDAIWGAFFLVTGFILQIIGILDMALFIPWLSCP